MSAPMRPSSNSEVAAHIRQWAARDNLGRPFSWPTDGCTYEQHIRFVEHRNAHWRGITHGEFLRFVLAYAESLETSANVAAEARQEEL